MAEQNAVVYDILVIYRQNRLLRLESNDTISKLVLHF